LLALGVIFVYFFEKSRWRQLVLIVSTIPIAIFTNAIRISLTGFLAQNYGPQVADSFFHGFSGWLIFLAALVMLFVLYSAIRALLPDVSRIREAKSTPNNHLPQPNSANNTIPLIISIIFLFSVGIWGHATAKIPPARIEGGLRNFPLLFNNWQGRPIDIDPEIIRLSGAEDAFNATYTSDAGGLVTLYIGYRASPFTESENFFHSPNVCLPSLGWKTLAISDHEVLGVPGFDKIVVRKMFIEKMGYRQLVYYWFQTKSRVSSNVNINRIHLTLHALRRDSTHDLFIRPMTPLKPSETAREASERLDRFVRDLVGTLLTFLSAKQALSP
jgi:EpsI family protein